MSYLINWSYWRLVFVYLIYLIYFKMPNTIPSCVVLWMENCNTKIFFLKFPSFCCYTKASLKMRLIRNKNWIDSYIYATVLSRNVSGLFLGKFQLINLPSSGKLKKKQSKELWSVSWKFRRDELYHLYFISLETVHVKQISSEVDILARFLQVPIYFYISIKPQL